jgi:arginine/lysine/ornithine decarboxylase
LPPAGDTPRYAYQRLVKNEVQHLPVADAGGMTVAAGIVPYPPGIPVVMPGEIMTEGGVHQKYLLALEAYDKKFPGFGHDNHGVENIDGTYHIYVYK